MNIDSATNLQYFAVALIGTMECHSIFIRTSAFLLQIGTKS